MTQISLVKSNESQFSRFQVFQATTNNQGKLENKKTVGMAYMKEGQNLYTLRLWTFVHERFYILGSTNDPSKYLVMTRELNKSEKAKSKYFWNIVGNGTANSSQGAIALQFDLFEKPIYMNIFPENSAYSSAMPDPVELSDCQAA